jgi:excisionase family DNA binding protein
VSARLLSLDECAERTSTTVRWWRRAVSERRLPVHHLGRLVRIDERDLEAFIAENRQEAEDSIVTAFRAPRRRSRGGPP